jgi:hypothetical protein
MNASLPTLPLPELPGGAAEDPPHLGVSYLPLAAILGPAGRAPAELPPLQTSGRAPRATADASSDFTDDDLRDALEPLLGGVSGGLPTGDEASFEALLRATFRRALAEHHGGPFHDPGLAHRLLWRTQALFTSRSYDEVLSEKIRRFHVEEVHLLDRDRLSLVSYASCDPVRHAHPRRVGSFARQLALRIADDAGAPLPGFDLGEGRRAVVRPGEFSLLVAVVRGEIDELLKSDLDFALRRIERRFREPFREGRPLLRELQPFLEECLLIHSPAAPASA